MKGERSFPSAVPTGPQGSPEDRAGERTHLLACPGQPRTLGAARRMCKKLQNPVRRRVREHWGFHWYGLEIITVSFTLYFILLSTHPF